jgi:hypothetical protein
VTRTGGSQGHCLGKGRLLGDTWSERVLGNDIDPLAQQHGWLVLQPSQGEKAPGSHVEVDQEIDVGVGSVGPAGGGGGRWLDR